MSRLDDELKLIYGRKEPSPDFTSRVMQQVAARQAAEPVAASRNLWRSLLEMIQPPRVRWAAVGFAACLLVALFAAQQSRREAPAASEPTVAAQAEAPSSGAASNPDETQVAQPAKIAAHRGGGRRGARYTGAQNIGRSKERVSKEPVDEKALAEGEAAKEKVMLALQIASSALNEAQRMVQGDSRRGDR